MLLGTRWSLMAGSLRFDGRISGRYGSDAQKFRLTPAPGYVTIVQQAAATDNAKFRIESAGMKSW
jgi:hypothetical protein